MGRHRIAFALLTFLAASATARAQSPFSTELALSFGYEGGKTEQPLVASGGVPSSAFTYRADSTARSLAVAAMRYLSPVPDDGVTPRALLPYVARVSSVAASLDLTGTSRDSAGTSRGGGVTLDARLTGDRTSSGGVAGAEIYLVPWAAVRGAFGVRSVRGNDTTFTTETPSGLGSLGSLALRSSSTSGSLGLVARLPLDASLALDATYASGDTARTDRSAFTGGGGVRETELHVDARSRAVALSGRVLLLSRRLDVGAAARYTEVDADLDQEGQGALDASHRIERRLYGEATWYAGRTFGLGAFAAYESDDESSGLTTTRPSLTGKETELGVAARWFPRAGASVGVRASRATVDRVVPPDATSFQRLVDTADRVELTVSLRF